MMMNLFNLLWNIKFMKVVKVDGSLHNHANNKTKNSYEPYLVLITIFFHIYIHNAN
jgi:hypothetical protein